MNTPSTPPPLPRHSGGKSFFSEAATASLLAVPAAIAVNFASGLGSASLDPEMRRLLSMVFAIFAGVILLLGLVAGVIALFGIPKYGTKGILGKALAGILLPVLLAILAIPALLGSVARAKQLQKGPGPVDEQLVSLAARLNSQAPTPIDAETTLVGVTALPNRTIQYQYSIISKAVSDFPQGALEAAVLPRLLQVYQSSPDMAAFRDNSVTIIYRYTDREGQLIDQFTVGPDDLPKE